MVGKACRELSGRCLRSANGTWTLTDGTHTGTVVALNPSTSESQDWTPWMAAGAILTITGLPTAKTLPGSAHLNVAFKEGGTDHTYTWKSDVTVDNGKVTFTNIGPGSGGNQFTCNT